MDLAREDMERENTFALWRPRIGKSRKKKKNDIVVLEILTNLVTFLHCTSQ